MATSFFYIYAMATSFFYIYVMVTSFFYIYIDIYKLTERPVVLLNAIFSAGFTGCVGALRENTTLLAAYAIFLAILLLLEVQQLFLSHQFVPTRFCFLNSI